MATGDLKNNVKQLLQELKAVKYGKTLDIDLVKSGSPQAYLPVYHFLFTTYSTKLNAEIVNSNNELYGKSDMRFMEAMYKILRDLFDFKAKITRDQFFAPGFAEHKVIMATDVLRVVKDRFPRYRPPKSSAFHVAEPRTGHGASTHPEKVVQEPSDPLPLSKHVTPTVAGAIVLPTKSAQASRGYMIPKSGHSGLKHHQERPVFAPPVSVRSSSASTSSKSSQRPKREDGDIEPIVVRAWEEPGIKNGHIGGRQPLLLQGAAAAASPPKPALVGLDSEAVEKIVRSKIYEMLSPALVKLNERVGMLEVDLTDMQQREQPPERPEPPPLSALMTQLSKQMNDIMFKLQTVVSRLTLVENRVTMVEAQLSEEENHRKTMIASQSYLQSKRPAASPEIPPNLPAMQQKPPIPSLATRSNPSLFHEPEQSKMQAEQTRIAHDQSRKLSSHQEGNTEDQTAGRDTGLSSRSVAVQEILASAASSEAQMPAVDFNENKEREVPVPQPGLAFMKTLVNPEDCGSLLTTSEVEAPEDITATEMDSTTAETAVVDQGEPQPHSLREHQAQQQQQQQQHVGDKGQLQHQGKAKPTSPSTHQHSNRRNPPPSAISDFSPIRPFKDLSLLEYHQEELSSINFPCYDADESGAADRRSSTPTGAGPGLDTSTLDRVTRINQMMAATQQLLQ